ncbi:MAG: hypothetical protein FD163_2398 [Hyphomonadaceae bacterium]|nr:MAG: hypothetical protein FD128_257 [Hyphomonadaceae bacterium]KAF0183281.1 MAG: hypothetical protein FD163_2398 [Hyphomonadaceae bacterium]
MGTENSKNVTPKKHLNEQLLRHCNKYPKTEMEIDLHKFIIEYIHFENTAKQLLQIFKNSKYKPCSIKIDEINKMNGQFNVINRNELILELLGSNSPYTLRHTKSARQLRNPIFHEWNKQDRDEAIKRVCDFSTKFKEFNNYVLNWANSEKSQSC